MKIGTKIKEVRKLQKMKLYELAEKSGVQIATLSRMEHGKMTGTLESHMSIARALGVDITELYKDIIREDAEVEIKKPSKHQEVFVHSDQSSYEILTNKVLSKKMMPIMLKIEPHGKSNKEQNQIGTEKFVYVREGKIIIHIGEEAYALSKDNSMYFNAGLEHYFENPGAGVAKVVCVITPVAL